MLGKVPLENTLPICNLIVWSLSHISDGSYEEVSPFSANIIMVKNNWILAQSAVQSLTLIDMPLCISNGKAFCSEFCIGAAGCGLYEAHLNMVWTWHGGLDISPDISTPATKPLAACTSLDAQHCRN